MELSRRDALAALAAIGAAGGAAYGASRLLGDAEPVGGEAESRRSPTLLDDEHVRETLVAVAHVVYPAEVSGIEPFVETFLEGRLEPSEHARGLRRAVADLDEAAIAWHGDRVVALPEATRDRLLREVGADTADEDPAGTTAERVRYYVVNELLLALYASPTGGELVGIENPRGYPGGTASYQRGPP